jgi:hypothetical protein
MKSGNKVLYNHRIAQSKEKWETDFLSKIKNGNDLLYLAANKNFGWGKVNDSLYTADSRNSLISRLDEIINNPYNQRNHPDFAGLKDEAIAKLDAKIAANSSNDNSGRPGFEPPRSTVRPDVVTGTSPTKAPENLVQQSDLSFDAQEIITMLDELSSLKDKSQDEFKRQYDERIKEISQIYRNNDKLTQTDKIAINAKFDNLRIDYMNIMYPEGHWEAGNSTFISDYRIAADDAYSLLEDRGTKPDESIRNQIEKILNIYQKYHLNKNPRNSDVFQYFDKLNKSIANWNFRNSKTLLPLKKLENPRSIL